MIKNRSHKKSLLLLLVLWLGLGCSLAYGWNHTGHLVVGQIAYDNLTPNARAHIDPIIHRLKADYPESSTFVTSAAWMDDIKAHGVRLFDSWHYIDYPWCPQKSVCNKDPIEHANAVNAILQSETIVGRQASNGLEKAIFLRVLIHVVGDIHQPLHGISMVNAHFPHGDNGATLYKIKGPADTLHAYWDSGLGVFSLSPYAAMHQPKKIQALAQQLEKEYPPSYFGKAVDELQPQQWAKESFQTAKDVVYKTPEGKVPNQAYIAKGQEVAKQRAALAGYRLARILNQFFA